MRRGAVRFKIYDTNYNAHIVWGYPVKIEGWEEMDWLLHEGIGRENDTWSVSDRQAGCKINSWVEITPQRAIAAAKARLAGKTKDEVRKAIQQRLTEIKAYQLEAA